jgi:hypothetical protein
VYCTSYPFTIFSKLNNRIRSHLCRFCEGAEAGLNGVQMSVRRPDAFAVAGNSACPVQVSPYRCNSFFCGHGLDDGDLVDFVVSGGVWMHNYVRSVFIFHLVDA